MGNRRGTKFELAAVIVRISKMPESARSYRRLIPDATMDYQILLQETFYPTIHDTSVTLTTPYPVVTVSIENP
jgi:hypothetical protein